MTRKDFPVRYEFDFFFRFPNQFFQVALFVRNIPLRKNATSSSKVRAAKSIAVAMGLRTERRIDDYSGGKVERKFSTSLLNVA